MTNVIKQQSQITEQTTQEILENSGFKVGPGLIKSISDKIFAMVQGVVSYNFKQRFKEGGLFGMAGDALKAVFKKPKQQPIVEDAISKTNITKAKESDSPGTSDTQLLVPGSNNNKGNKPKEKDFLQTEEKAKVVLIGGITEVGIKNLKEKLPDIFKEVFKKLPKTETKSEDLKTKFSEGGLLGMLPKGLLAMGGGLTLLLGGLAALVTGLQTDGPFKGLLKIFSKVGLQGGLKMLEKGAITFLKTLNSFIKAPTNLLKTVYKSLRGIFGKSVAKGVVSTIKPLAGLFGKLLTGLVKFITPLLKRLPLVGTVISFGFAYTRFKSGDTIGGIIDILSGIATLVPGVGTAISIGLDVLNAFLDYKAGGASPEASAKKAGMIGDFFGSIWDWIKEKAVSVFGWFIDLGELIAQAKWGDVFQKLAGWVPGLDWMLGWLGTSTEEMVKGGNELGQQYIDVIANFTDWVKTNILDKITGFVGGITDKFKVVGSFLGIGEEEPEIPEADIPKGRKSARGSKPKMAEGGVISTEMEAEVGEDGDEAIVQLAEGGVVATKPTTTPIDKLNQSAVIPLEKYFNGKDFTLSNDFLREIADNTGGTNKVLEMLSQAIGKLAYALEISSNKQPTNTIIGTQQQGQTPSASQIAASNNDAIRAVRRQFSMA